MLSLKYAAALLVLAFIMLGGVPARASWLIDPSGFHVSVHGQTSCLDCHEDVPEKDLHPNPAEVGKGLTDFFRPEKCYACHDETRELLEKGRHGRDKVKEKAKYNNCLECHDPHYQASLESPEKKECGHCHEYKKSLPPPDADSEPCLACHLEPEAEDPQAHQRISALCFYCHALADKPRSTSAPLINTGDYQAAPHAGLSCLECHQAAAGFNHARQPLVNCLGCHDRHEASVARDAHLGVTCLACHLTGLTPVRDPGTRLVLPKKDRRPGKPTRVHNLVRTGEPASCRRCHHKGNSIKASAMVLPAKGVLCLPCHAAGFSAGDLVTRVSLLIFLLGLLGLAFIVLSGTLGEGNKTGFMAKAARIASGTVKAVCSPKIVKVLEALVLDVLVQRRLYKRSKARWAIHGLIFYPFVFRCLWGLVALTSSKWLPWWSGAWAMLDRNNPAGAFLFDLTGVMIILGVVLAAMRKLMGRGEDVPGLPRQDRPALCLLAAMVVTGFILEGFRLAMSAAPPGGEYAFLGYSLSLMLSGLSGLTEAYGYVWYSHAVLVGAFAAYLPFSRMLHLILAPLVLIVNEVSDAERHEVE